MKRLSAYFNKKSRLLKQPAFIEGHRGQLAEFEPHTLAQRLAGLLQVQNDFFPCFDWTFPPPVLQPASQPGSATELFSEPAIIPDRYSLYLHIPFCKTLCNFCYYTVFPGKGIQESERYIDYLLREIKLYSPVLDGKTCESVYIGGGTPTYLDNRLLVRLLETLQQHVDLDPHYELSIEAAPGTLPENKLRLLKSLGITRLSYGIQTLDEGLLASMNRYYSVAEAVNELDMAVRLIGNVNVDTMYGFDEESDTALLDTLKTFDDLGIPSLSIYALDKQRCQSVVGAEAPLVDEAYQQKIQRFETAKTWLQDRGYQSVLQNIFIKPGLSSYRHQLRRWENLPLVALGVSSQGYAPRKPYQNAMSLKSYYQLLDEDKLPIVTVDLLTPAMEMARELTSKLRFTEVSVSRLGRKYGIDVAAIYRDLIEALTDLGFVEFDGDVLRMTEKADYYNNIIPMLFAPDDYKQQLLSLPEEYIENFPIPRILTHLGRTQSQAIKLPAIPGSISRPERRKLRDRRLFQDTSYLAITGGCDRRVNAGRRVNDHQSIPTFIDEFI